jgi:hypothetical protein
MNSRKLVFLFLLVSISASNLFVLPSHAQFEQPYQLRLSISISPFLLPVQHLPITVSFEIKNIGNKTFNGKATLDVKTEKHFYTTNTFMIVNLTKDAVYKNSSSYTTDDEGRYWATVTMESNDSTRIYLYVGSTLIDKATRLEYTDSIYLYGIALIIPAIVGLVTIIGVIVAYLTYRKTPEKTSKKASKKTSRKRRK